MGTASPGATPRAAPQTLPQPLCGHGGDLGAPGRGWHSADTPRPRSTPSSELGKQDHSPKQTTREAPSPHHHGGCSRPGPKINSCGWICCAQEGPEARGGQRRQAALAPRRGDGGGSGMPLWMPGSLYQLGADSADSSNFAFSVGEQVWKGSVFTRKPIKAGALQHGRARLREHWVRGERCDVWFSAGGECELFRPGLFNLQSNVFLYPAPKRLGEGPTQGSVYPLFFPWGQP